jgi:hypothetical protein
MMGVLKIIGIPIGDHFSEPYAGNEKGEFEHLDMRNINYEITKCLTGNTVVYGYYKDVNMKEMMSFKPLIKRGIETYFGSFTCFAFKDPRVTFLLPLYVECLLEMNYCVSCICMSRPHQEMVDSFAHGIKGMDKFGWVTHDIIEKYVSHGKDVLDQFKICELGKRCSFIYFTYQEMLDNREESLRKVYNFLSPLKNSHSLLEFKEALEQVNSFLDPSLKHF